MKNIERTASVRSKRLHNSYVDRTRTKRDVAAVDPVNPVQGGQNNTNYASANHLMTSDSFYEKLENLRKEYLSFYHNEQNLERVIEQIETDEAVLAEAMEELIQKYNLTIKSLDTLDHRFNTDYSETIYGMLKGYERYLNTIGIRVSGDKTLQIAPRTFLQKLEGQNGVPHGLFKPIHNLIIRLYRQFRSIKIPHQPALEGDYGYSVDSGYEGMIVDEQS